MLPKPRVHEAMALKDYLRILYSSNPEMESFYSDQKEEVSSVTIAENASVSNPPRKRFQCEICHEKFASRQGLNQHVGRMHSVTEDPVSCTLCNRNFKHKHALLYHIRQVHEKSTRVICHVCGKSCYNKHVALRHFRMKHDTST